MPQEQVIVKRYSEAFKRKVIEEIESGKMNASGAKQLYNIGGGATIGKWLRRYGKNHLMAKVVRIETTSEVNRVKELEKEKQALESALAQAHLKAICLESQLAVAEEMYGVDRKNLERAV